MRLGRASSSSPTTSRKRSISATALRSSPARPAISGKRCRSICRSRATRSSPGSCRDSSSCATCCTRRSGRAPMPDVGRLLVRSNWPGFCTIALGFLLWELLLRAGLARYENLPPPSVIAGGLLEIMRNGQLMADALHTLRVVLVGWAAALVIGVVSGLCLGVSATLRDYSLASIEVLRPMPGIAFAPVALLLFGFSLQMELLVVILPALWPVLINTMGAVAGVHARLFDVGRTFRLSRSETLRRIMLPAALPGVLVGARLSLT